MRTTLVRTAGLALGLGLVIGPAAAAATPGDEPARAHAQDDAPADVLKGQGLSRPPNGTTWHLDDEAEVLKAQKDVHALAARRKSAEAQLRQVESGDGDPKTLAQSLRNQAAMLGQQAAAMNVDLQQLSAAGRYGGRAAALYRNVLSQQRNQVVQEQQRLNALAGQVQSEGGEYQKQKLKFTDEVGKVRASHEEALDALRDSARKLMARYNELARDEAVARALAALPAVAGAPQKLGPSRDLTAVLKTLGISSALTTETVALHKGKAEDRTRGDATVDVYLNGRGPVPMAVDPAAPQTVLPAALASQYHLKPTGRQAEWTRPDGSKATAPEMVIANVRVGAHSTASGVTCAAVPPDQGDVAPRLGRSFLDHFEARPLPDAGILLLTREAPAPAPDEPAAKPAPAAKAKAKGPSSKRRRPAPAEPPG